MHPLARDLHKRATHVGHDSPLGLEQELHKAVAKGRRTVRELIGAIQLNQTQPGCQTRGISLFVLSLYSLSLFSVSILYLYSLFPVSFSTSPVHPADVEDLRV